MLNTLLLADGLFVTSAQPCWGFFFYTEKCLEKTICLQNKTTTSCNRGGSNYCKKKTNKKTRPKPADCNQDTSSLYITTRRNIPRIYFTICLSSLILGCAALLNDSFKANQSGEEKRGGWQHPQAFSFGHPSSDGAARRSAGGQRRPRFPPSVGCGRGQNPTAMAASSRAASPGEPQWNNRPRCSCCSLFIR